ncbi:type II toxin-antitoxin system VapC family toxin [Planomonospora parontospora]|uniref:type II toxin-antitoxin system VapC family toxin n=1 Tax=Planomonospora parontospora TaxID=58119 RepID=UPI0016716078|nr:type II toxin-antitoxin system VapC family toxin [Planomonospora parontospora]GGL46111.1 DNA-binding protein [Planomonospora parontospora subsp. antibiotica]GII16210.1 DNA-binding protein [Planomonospora parontospora subsp. antibiotica]
MANRVHLRPVPERPITLVDSCVLLDILMDDPKWADWSDEAVAQAREEGPVAINQVIYAEISVGFTGIEDLDEALPAGEIERYDLPYEAGFLAGKAFAAYRQRGGQKRSPLPDFYIGAHAALQKYRLITRDTARYRTYFPTVTLITPDTDGS